MTRPQRDISQILETVDVATWEGPAHTNRAERMVSALEDGNVLYLPRLAFELSQGEQRFLTPASADSRAKNISYDANTDTLKHAVGPPGELAAIKAMIRRYQQHTLSLMSLLLPGYMAELEIGRTSFRPAEIAGRGLSPEKDDTRLHVDAFPSTPTGGKRILRVFTNVNLEGRGRDWRLGERFEDVAENFLDRVPKQSGVAARLLKIAGITKSYRTQYDRLMLGMHDTMKSDDTYQQAAVQNAFSFPPGSTWLVFTDKVSHAAMGGQHLFEQTFYLPLRAMADAEKAPLRILERLSGRLLA